MFIATVFIMVKTWKQPKYPSDDEMDKQYLRFPILKQKETNKKPTMHCKANRLWEPIVFKNNSNIVLFKRR